MEKENIYIDLSKCSEGERNYIRTKIFNSEFPVATLTRHILENMIVRKFNGTPYLLINEFDHWKLDRCYMDKTELTYTEFIKLFEGGDEENNTYSFSYLSCGKTLTVHIEAKNFNKAMIKFATNYHDIEWLYHAKIL